MLECFIKNFNFFSTEERMDILDDMGVSKLSAQVFSKVTNSFTYKHKYHIKKLIKKTNQSITLKKQQQP